MQRSRLSLHYQPRPAAAGYAVAIVSVAASLALSLLLRPLTSPNPFLFFFAAIAISAWYGGLGPGLLATVASLLLANFFLILPDTSAANDALNALRLAVFALVAILISGLTEARRRAEHDAATQRNRLQVTLAREQAAHSRVAALAHASRLLAGSLDVPQTLRQISSLLVPQLADWCVIDLVAQDGAIEMAAAAHVDPSKVRWADELRRQFPLNMESPAGAPHVIRTGEPQLVADIPDELLEAVARTPDELLALRAVGYRSLMVVPLQARGRVLGAISMVVAESARRYSEEDLAFAQELAARAAVAIDNANLYRAAQTSEAQLRLIADALPVLMSYLDHDRRYRFNNRAYEAWFEATREQITGRHIREVIGEDAYDAIRPHLDAALAGAEVSFETLVRYRAGGERHIHATYVPDRDEAGAVRGVVVLVEDITARVRAEEARDLLVAASAALAGSLDYDTTLAQLVRLVVPTLGDYAAGYLVEGEGRVTRSAAAHTDPAMEPLLSEMERRYPPAAHGESPLARVLRTGRPEIANGLSDASLRQLAADDEHQRLLSALGARSLMAVPLQARGRMLGAAQCVSSSAGRQYTPDDLHLLEEIAHRAALALDNAALYRATEEARTGAEEALHQRDLFLSVASHELKTPLTTLIGQVQLLERRLQRAGLLLDPYARSLTTVVAQAGRLNRMVDALLDVSRIELGQLSLERAPVDLGQLARRVVADLQPMAESHEIRFEGPADGLLVHGDELRLEQVIQNLLQNAIKYSPAGGPVAVGVAARGDQVCVTVTDQGIGLPEEELSRIFDRFYRASNADPRQISGMGIGLYVVKEIVRLHGGVVRAEARPGGGSRFTVCLPREGGAPGAVEPRELGASL